MVTIVFQECLILHREHTIKECTAKLSQEETSIHYITCTACCCYYIRACMFTENTFTWLCWWILVYTSVRRLRII